MDLLAAVAAQQAAVASGHSSPQPLVEVVRNELARNEEGHAADEAKQYKVTEDSVPSQVQGSKPSTVKSETDASKIAAETTTLHKLAAKSLASKVDVKIEPEHRNSARPKPILEPKAVKAEPKPDLKSHTKPSSKSQPKSQPKSQSKVVPKTESKVVPKVESNAEAKFKAEPKPKSKTEPKSEPKDSGSDEEEQDYVNRCICGFSHNDDHMIQCDECEVWQHIECFEDLNKQKVPDNYLCEQCKPRPFNAARARALQQKKLKLLEQLEPSSSEDESDLPRGAGKGALSKFDVIEISDEAAESAKAIDVSKLEKIEKIEDAKLCVSKRLQGKKTLRGLYLTRDTKSNSLLGSLGGVLRLPDPKEIEAILKNRKAQLMVWTCTSKNICVDSRVKGNEFRWVRRSCTPTAKVEIVNVDDQLRTMLYSVKDGSKGDEVTIAFDYDWKASPYRVTCACGVKDCEVSATKMKQRRISKPKPTNLTIPQTTGKQSDSSPSTPQQTPGGSSDNLFGFPASGQKLSREERAFMWQIAQMEKREKRKKEAAASKDTREEGGGGSTAPSASGKGRGRPKVKVEDTDSTPQSATRPRGRARSVQNSPSVRGQNEKKSTPGRTPKGRPGRRPTDPNSGTPARPKVRRSYRSDRKLTARDTPIAKQNESVVHAVKTQITPDQLSLLKKWEILPSLTYEYNPWHEDAPPRPLMLLKKHRLISTWARPHPSGIAASESGNENKYMKDAKSQNGTLVPDTTEEARKQVLQKENIVNAASKGPHESPQQVKPQVVPLPVPQQAAVPVNAVPPASSGELSGQEPTRMEIDKPLPGATNPTDGNKASAETPQAEPKTKKRKKISMADYLKNKKKAKKTAEVSEVNETKKVGSEEAKMTESSESSATKTESDVQAGENINKAPDPQVFDKSEIAKASKEVNKEDSNTSGLAMSSTTVAPVVHTIAAGSVSHNSTGNGPSIIAPKLNVPLDTDAVKVDTADLQPINGRHVSHTPEEEPTFERLQPLNASIFPATAVPCTYGVDPVVEWQEAVAAMADDDVRDNDEDDTSWIPSWAEEVTPQR